MKKHLLIIVIIFPMILSAQCWQKVVSANTFTLALKQDGTLWAWGQNLNGQIGNGTDTDIDQHTPVQVGTANDWIEIYGGIRFALAKKSNGSLWAWGQNVYGQLGDGTTEDKNIPVQVGTDTDWDFVSAGSAHVLAIKTDGSLWGWGINAAGALGNGSTAPVAVTLPILINNDKDWQSVSAGGTFSTGLKNDGTIWAWGYNGYGQFGNGTTTDSYVPVQIGTDTDWANIDSGTQHTIALKTNGTLWGWGSNYEGAVGNGTVGFANNALFPVQLGTDTDWQIAYAGLNVSTALKTNGSLWMWGNNQFGGLGIGSYSDQSVPAKLGTTNDWLSVSDPSTSCAAFKTDMTLWIWGYNGVGQLGDDTLVNKNAPINVVCSILYTPEMSYVKGIVYPNPAVDVLHFSFPEKVTSVVLFDLSGKKIMEHSNGSIENFSVLDLQKGMYMLKFECDGKDYWQKVIKQ